MKSRSLFLTFLLSLCFGIAEAGAQPKQQTIDHFYSELSGFGVWLQDEQRGFFWVSYEDDGFRPYFTNGYWAMTEFGNTWVSYYPWGWATFHYGRWMYDGYYGWVWFPGTEWGPAWVQWISDKNFYGWRPLSIDSLEHKNRKAPADWWTMVPKHHIYLARSLARYNASNNESVLKNARPINNTYTNKFNGAVYITGPDHEEVCRVTNNQICEETGQNVMVHKLHRLLNPAPTEIRRCEIYMYRPEFITTSANLAPKDFIKAEVPLTGPAPVGTDRRPPFRDKLDFLRKQQSKTR